MSEIAQNETRAPRVPDWMDRIEARIVELGGEVQRRGEVLADFPVEHRFTPGLYSREIFMPAGSVVVSRVHLTEHPYVVSKGRVRVYIPEVGWEEIAAPHTGITKPGTRRLLVVVEDTVWTTFHPTNLTDVAEIDAQILGDYENPILAGGGSPQIEEGA